LHTFSRPRSPRSLRHGSSLIPEAGKSKVEVILSEAQNGAQLALYTGDTLVVRLLEMPDGCHWTLTSIDSNCLEMMEHRAEPARTSPGSAGASIWRFRPTGSGRTRLELTKAGAWRAADPAPERFAVELELR
jgi:predicted secreted protein